MNLRPLGRLLGGAILLASSTVAFAAAPTIDQLLNVKNVSRPRISPDARFVAFEKTETDWKENAYVTHLWLADTQSGRTFQLTGGKKSTTDAQWSPDGRWLAFLTEREADAIAPPDEKTEKEKTADAKPDSRQIWIISPLGGEARMLTKHGAKIDSYRWSPDGKRLAFAAPVPESKAAKDRKEKYSDYEVYEEDYEQNQLWLVDVAASEDGARLAAATRLVNDPKITVSDVEWSPDGSRVAFTGSANPMLAFGGTADLYTIEVAKPGTPTKIVALEGPDDHPHFSPDGSEVAFSTSLAEKYFFYTNGHIASVKLAAVLAKPATTRADVTDLTASFDEDTELLDWAPNGVLFRAQQKTRSHVFRIDPTTKAIARVTAPDDFFVGDVSFDRTFKNWAYSAADATHVTEIFTGRASAAARKLTDMTAQFAGMDLGSVELVSWKSKDGTPIEGVLHKPAKFDPSRKYPLLVVIHGGPTGVSRPVFNPANRTYPIEAFLAKGALVLEPNYRGSAGYGAKFRALNVRNLGVGDMWDVMSGVDAMIARGSVDPTKLGAMGWSQGGYISAFLATNTDRFKAISDGAGISDWTTYYVNTDITPFTRQYLQATPWDDPKVYALTSPITNIRNAKTPTLIQHGEKDKRVPPPNAFELYRGLRDVGVPSTLIVYAGFGHGINKPKSNRAVLQHNYDWFSHWVFGEEIPKDSPLRGSGAVVDHSGE
ncbi:MAG: S9 family peptidase [Acidobacteria bacterium]|nr:S9 family peptidase [Acidobacteriota bacterium]